MFYSILSGLRSIRVSLVTGGIIVTSSYIFFYEILYSRIVVRPAMCNLLEISTVVPIILALAISLIVGSLYTTLLEGIVDSIHRRHVMTEIASTKNFIKRILVGTMLPYSESAKKRLTSEVSRFYLEYSGSDSQDNQTMMTDFINTVFIEALWMEGKIAGTSIELPYDRMRSEGEMRLAGGLLLPYASSAIAYALYATNFQFLLALLLGIAFAVPMINYGLYYFKKANSFLAHHISDGKVLSPSMETLKRAYNWKHPKEKKPLVLQIEIIGLKI